MPEDLELRARLERRIDELPVLPTVVGQLMVLDREDDGYFDRVLELIESDPTFASRMLSAANAASSSPTSPVISVRAALSRLGSAAAANMILAVAVSRVFIPRDKWEKSLWRHAIQVGGAMRSLATFADGDLDLDGDEAYTAGLLHDVGRLVMFDEAPETLRQVYEGDWDSPDALVEFELSICGISHCELGQMALERWGLPSVLGEVVLHHHEPNIDPRANRVGALAATTRFADLAMFPSALSGDAGYDAESLETIERELMPKLPSGISISPSELQEVIRTTIAESELTCIALGIA